LRSTDEGETANAVRVSGGDGERDGSAVGVAHEDRTIEAELIHELDEHVRHFGEGSAGGGAARDGPFGVSGAGEIHSDDAVILGQSTEDALVAGALRDQAVEHEDR
jgi:hypothetical protein